MFVLTEVGRGLLQARNMPKQQCCFGPQNQACVVFSRAKTCGTIWVHTITLNAETGGEVQDIPLEVRAQIREVLEPYRRMKEVQNEILRRLPNDCDPE